MSIHPVFVFAKKRNYVFPSVSGIEETVYVPYFARNGTKKKTENPLKCYFTPKNR